MFSSSLPEELGARSSAKRINLRRFARQTSFFRERRRQGFEPCCDMSESVGGGTAATPRGSSSAGLPESFAPGVKIDEVQQAVCCWLRRWHAMLSFE